MSRHGGSVLYDAPGPRTRRIERVASTAVLALLVVGAIWVVHGMADRGLFDDRWAVLTDPPKSQSAQDVWQSLGRGLLATLKAAAVAAPLALALALVLSAMRTARSRVVSVPAVAIIELLRGVPVLLMMLFGLLAFGMPTFTAVVFGLALYNAAIVAEILRAGLVALPRGQREAGTAIGLTSAQTLRIVLLPQVVRLMLPSLISQFVVLLKDSSLGFVIGYQELLRTMQLNYSFFGDRYRVPLFVVVLLIYLAVNITLSRVAVLVERRLSRRGQGVPDATAQTPEVSLASASSSSAARTSSNAKPGP